MLGRCRRRYGAAEEHFGGIDVLLNNAGRGWYGSIEGMDEAQVRAMFELNFFGVLSVVRAVLPGMRARGSGWIINMSSVAGLRGVTGFGFYSATKFAVEAVTDVLREEVAAQGIRVMAVEPGAFRTRAYAGFADEPIKETIPEYKAMLEQVRAAMIDTGRCAARRSSTRRTRSDSGHEPRPASPTAGPRQRMDSTLRSPPSRRTWSTSARTKPSSRGADFPDPSALRFDRPGEAEDRPADLGAPVGGRVSRGPTR